MKDSGSEDDLLIGGQMNKGDPDLYRRQTVVSAGTEKDPKECF